MRKTESGTTLVEFDHRDQRLGSVTFELEVDWTLTPSLPASRTEPAEGPDLEIRAIRGAGVDGTSLCPDEVHDAFVTDEAAMTHLYERAIGQVAERAETLADDAAHAVTEPGF